MKTNNIPDSYVLTPSTILGSHYSQAWFIFASYIHYKLLLSNGVYVYITHSVVSKSILGLLAYSLLQFREDQIIYTQRLDKHGLFTSSVFDGNIYCMFVQWQRFRGVRPASMGMQKKNAKQCWIHQILEILWLTMTQTRGMK